MSDAEKRGDTSKPPDAPDSDEDSTPEEQSTESAPPGMQRLADLDPETVRRHMLESDLPLIAGEEALETEWAEQNEEDTRESRRWSLLWVGTLAASLVGATLVIANWRDPQPPVFEPEPLPEILSDAEEKRAVSAVLLAFSAAQTVEERLELVLEPERVEPAMRNYYENQGPAPFRLQEVTHYESVWIREHRWCFAKCLETDSKVRFAGLRLTADGFLLDWESFVAYGELSWNSLLEERPRDPVQMRVYLSYSGYFNHKYADPEAWVSFEVEPKEGGPAIIGYAAMGSRAHRQLFAAVPPGVRQPANIRLRFEEDAGADDLAIIEEVLHRRWTAPSVAFPERFSNSGADAAAPARQRQGGRLPSSAPE